MNLRPDTSLEATSTLIEAAKSRFGIVGRERELSLIDLALKSGRHLLIEGPVGVGKTVLAQAVTELRGRKWFRVDGDSRFSETKLTGSFNPAQVLKEGYTESAFTPGPLVQAMREGGILFINELNRMPESVQNVLLPVLDEGLLSIPYLGRVEASPGFLVIATQNPREFVATSHLSEALIDRMEWLSLKTQSEEEEAQIVLRALSLRQKILADSFEDSVKDLVLFSVQWVRATRTHPKLKRGASVRAAIALSELLLAAGFRGLQGPGSLEILSPEILACAKLALATRIELLSGTASGDLFEAELERILSELFESVKKKSKNFQPLKTEFSLQAAAPHSAKSST